VEERHIAEAGLHTAAEERRTAVVGIGLVVVGLFVPVEKKISHCTSRRMKAISLLCITHISLIVLSLRLPIAWLSPVSWLAVTLLLLLWLVLRVLVGRWLLRISGS